MPRLARNPWASGCCTSSRSSSTAAPNCRRQARRRPMAEPPSTRPTQSPIASRQAKPPADIPHPTRRRRASATNSTARCRAHQTACELWIRTGSPGTGGARQLRRLRYYDREGWKHHTLATPAQPAVCWRDNLQPVILTAASEPTSTHAVHACRDLRVVVGAGRTTDIVATRADSLSPWSSHPKQTPSIQAIGRKRHAGAGQQVSPIIAGAGIGGLKFTALSCTIWHQAESHMTNGGYRRRRHLIQKPAAVGALARLRFLRLPGSGVPPSPTRELRYI